MAHVTYICGVTVPLFGSSFLDVCTIRYSVLLGHDSPSSLPEAPAVITIVAPLLALASTQAFQNHEKAPMCYALLNSHS